MFDKLNFFKKSTTRLQMMDPSSSGIIFFYKKFLELDELIWKNSRVKEKIGVIH